MNIRRHTDIIRLNKSHIKEVARLCASAFMNDPDAFYIIPDEEARKKKLPRLFEFQIRYAILYGEAHAISDDVEGFALWLKSEDAKLSVLRLLRAGFIRLLFGVGIGIIARVLHTVFYSTVIQENCVSGSHWRLFLIAVHPAHQGKGHAGTLIRYMLRRADDERLPVFLDTYNERNVSIYKHFGFRMVHSGLLPRSTLNMWAMVRAHQP